MRNLIRFIIKNHYGILFVILEMLALVLLFRNNNYHKAGYLNWIQRVEASFHQTGFRIKKYTNLIHENEKLVNENIRLRDQILGLEYKIITDSARFNDTNTFNYYEFIPAKVINNSINKQHNYITLNKGSKDGIEREMGVISPNGVVGKVIRTSKNFSVVMSLLNRGDEFMVSSRIKRSNYDGLVNWEGDSYRIAYLRDIPHHVNLIPGDTIITSGFTRSFPENIVVGRIINSELEGNFHKVKLQLATDFKQLTNVYVLKNNYKNEIDSLESIQ